MTMGRFHALAALVIVAVPVAGVSADTETHERQWYVSGAAGGGWPDTPDLYSGGEPFRLSLGDAPMFSVAAGFVARRSLWGKRLRLEAELVSSKNDIDAYSGTAIVIDRRSDVSMKALMLNAEVSFSDGGSFAPYLGAGVGLGRVDFDTVSSSASDDSVWMAQVRAGLTFEPRAFENVSGFLVYRYVAAESTLHAFGRLKDYRLNALQLGVRYTF